MRTTIHAFHYLEMLRHELDCLGVTDETDRAVGLVEQVLHLVGSDDDTVFWGEEG